MKNLHPIFCFLLVFISISCHHKPIQYEPDWLAKLDSLYVWDIKPEINGAMMFLDVAYQTTDSCVTDFLTMSVAKHTSRIRPDWIAVILPDNILRKEGVFLFFDESKRVNFETENTKWSIRVNLDEHTNDTFAVRFKDGYALDDNNQKVDILQKFLESDRVFLMIFYSDGEHKTIAVPLKYFRTQYKTIEYEKPKKD